VSDDPPLLWQLTFSHFNEKARWALDFKRLAHRRRTLVPGAHAVRSKLLGGSGTLPILDLGARRLTDSAAIVAELERVRPEPALYPEDPEQRRRALELEAWMGTELGPGVRRALFHELLPQTRVAARVFFQGLSAPVRTLNSAALPVSRIAVRRALGADAVGAASGRRETLAALDRIEAELGPSEFLAGDAFSVADLSAAALLSPLVGPPEFAYRLPNDPWPPAWESFREECRGRVAWSWAEEMFRRYRGRSAEIA
jgi:glutathione S-transferase